MFCHLFIGMCTLEMTSWSKLPVLGSGSLIKQPNFDESGSAELRFFF